MYEGTAASFRLRAAFEVEITASRVLRHDMLCTQAGDANHAFAAIVCAAARAPALAYLRTNLHQHLRAQLELQGGSATSFHAALTALDAAWQRMHPFHQTVLEGIHGLSLAYVDACRQLVYLAGYGSCRAVAGSKQPGGTAIVSQGKPGAVFSVETVPLAEVGLIILGSTGLWCALPFFYIKYYSGKSARCMTSLKNGVHGQART